MSAFKPTTLVGENADLLVLLLYHVVVSKCSYLYFRSDKVKSNVYDIKSTSWCLEFAMTYCFSMPLLDATRCPEYLASGRNRRSNESSGTKRQ